MRCLWIVAVLCFGCSAALEHGLDESAANEVVTSLERAGIAASKTRDESNADSFVVSVGKSDVVRSLELLRSLGLPRGRRTGFGEVYKQGSLLPTPTEERARYIEALSGEIVKTLETVDGVASARVHLVLPEPEPLAIDRSARGPQAAVLVKTRGQSAPIAESDVRKLVSGSVPGLDPAAVSVVFTAATPPSANGAELVSLGPLRMTAGSRTIAIVLAATGCVLLAGLAVLLLAMVRRASRRGSASPTASS